MSLFQAPTSHLDPAPMPLNSVAHSGTVAHSSTVAHSGVVNRTHRTVRARARSLQARRLRARSLLLPLLVSSAMLMLLCYALWRLFDEYELNPNGLPDASNQLFVLILWFLPITAGVIGAIWFRRLRFRNREDVLP